MNTGPVIEEITVKAPASKVWKAITDPADMQNWYFPVERFDPEPGFEFKFYGEKDERKYPISCKIIAAEKDKSLSYTWSYDDFPAETIVTFDLFEEGWQTRIRLTHEGLEHIPEEHKEASRENHVEGWHQIIGSSLKEYVENN